MSSAKDVIRQTQERLDIILESFMNESIFESSTDSFCPLDNDDVDMLRTLNNNNIERRRRTFPNSSSIENSANSSMNLDVQILNTQNAPIVIDLCNIPSTPLLPNRNNTSNDDDVIFVSSDVIDLSTPAETIPTARRRERNRHDITQRRTIGFDEVEIQRRRRRRTDNDSGGSPKLQKNSSEESDSELHQALKCSVCLENMLQREPSTTKCGHVFCGSCIREAIRLTRKCPLCNTKLRQTNVSRIYF